MGSVPTHPRRSFALFRAKLSCVVEGTRALAAHGEARTRDLPCLPGMTSARLCDAGG